MNFPLARDFAPIGDAAIADPSYQIDGMVGAFYRHSGRSFDRLCQTGALRTDSEGPPMPEDATSYLRQEQNAAELSGMAHNPLHKLRFAEMVDTLSKDSVRTDSEYADVDWRTDSATAGGSVLARQLEAQWAQVLGMPTPPLLSLQLFPVNTDAGPGAENIRITRFKERGQAAIYAGGQAPIPTASLRQVADHIYFRHLVSGAQWSIFDQLAWNFARQDGVTKSLDVARRAVEQLHDQINWLGSPGHQLYGVTTFPWLNRRIVQTTFSSSADANAMIAEIVSLFSYPSEKSNEAYQPDSILIASKLMNFLTRTPRGAPNDSSLLDYIRKSINEIYEAQTGKKDGVTIRSVARLNDVGGTGIHGVFVFQNNPDAISILVSQNTTMLPLYQNSAQFMQVVYKTIGGVVMPNVGANIMGFVTGSGF